MDSYSNGEIWLSNNIVTRTIDKGNTYESIYESQSTQETTNTVTGNYSYPSFYEHFTYSHSRLSSNRSTTVLSKQTDQILSQTAELVDVYDDIETIKILTVTTNEYILIDSSLNKYRNNISKTYKYYKNNVLLNTVTENSFRDIYYDSNNREIEYISYDADNNKTAHYLVSHFNGPDGCAISNSYSDWTDTDLTQYSKGTTVTYTILQEDENKIVVQMDQETVQLSDSVSKSRGIYTFEKY